MNSRKQSTAYLSVFNFMGNYLKIQAVICLLFACFPSNAQNNGNSTRIEGKIIEYGTQETPMEHAMVTLLPANVYTLSDSKGEFAFHKVDTGKITIRIQFIGMESIDSTVYVVSGQSNRFMFRMKSADFRLEEVTVVATQSKAGASTASHISRQAIDHLQASTLSDLMQLLPGVVISNPNLNSANTVSIRGTDANNSLGTAIIVDGVQISNNANLQAFAATMNGSTGSLNGDAAAGVDTRTISLDNIESVEVIRGIPSAEYGDLTSGAVIIKSRAGKDPLKIKFKTNPDLYQGSVSKGLLLNDRLGSLNLSGDYLYTVKEPTEAYAFYQRLVTKALWTASFKKMLYTTTSFDLTFGKDTRNSNPNDNAIDLREGARELGVAFSNNSHLNINKGWLKSVEWVLAGRYGDKHSWTHEMLFNATGLYSTAMTDGSVVSNHPGQQAYDIAGNEITRLAGAEKAWATILPNEYYSDWDVYGKEINVNARLKVNFNKRWGNINNRIIAGADFKTDGNVGKGKVYDERNPPLRAFENRAYRNRAYSDIPFIYQLGLFAEDRYLHSFGERNLNISAGVRFDYMNQKSVMAPRLNASFDILPETLTLRGGYGLTAKMPTLIYLYPENAYFDYRLTPTVDPEELLLCETRIFSAENPNLAIAVNRKSEIGLDVKIPGKYRLSLTAYNELRRNDYSFSNTLNTIRLIAYRQYSLDNGAATGKALKLDNTYNVFAIYSEPGNSAYSHNRGMEFELDLGRFDAIRTSFYLNGAWERRTSKNQDYSFSTATKAGDPERHIGVYQKGRLSAESERLLTTVRITHNIPAIGFVVTLTAQNQWLNNTWTVYGNDMFEKYISYRDGKVYDFDPAKKDDPEFSYLFPGINSNRDLVEKNIPTLFFNLNLSKEISDYFTASFFANNLFNSRPLYESTVTPGTFRELGSGIFFGFDLKVSIK
ncbi:MAG: TonB-dependent receptor [Bacteroidales bacterium]|jgi:outer membrane receptor protein involved in Fe transport|nr:TonB-dependent receptor [Bacteroidales bacterium]